MTHQERLKNAHRRADAKARVLEVLLGLQLSSDEAREVLREAIEDVGEARSNGKSTGAASSSS